MGRWKPCVAGKPNDLADERRGFGAVAGNGSRPRWSYSDNATLIDKNLPAGRSAGDDDVG